MTRVADAGASRSFPAPAKLNLFFHITGVRDDGFHRVQTLYQLLDYGDEIDFALRDDGRLLVHCDAPEINDDNLVLRAAQTLQAACDGAGKGAEIRLRKRIPVAAGLGGGSSDAATTLLALNRLWDCGLNLEQLAAMGAGLGADVPVFVRGRSAWGEGVGERLTPVKTVPAWYAVFMPPMRLSTAQAFADADLKRDCPPVSMRDYLLGETRNVFEPVARRRAEVAGLMERLGGRARLSGSGPGVYVAFDDFDACARCIADAPDGVHAFAARGVDASPLHDICGIMPDNKPS